MNDQLEETSSGTIFTVDLENTTGTDITLSQALTVMQGAKGTGALRGSLLKLDREYFLPAHHVVTITLQNDELCAANADSKVCFSRNFNDDSEIVIFDEPRKYEIRIPIPGFTPPASEDSRSPAPASKGSQIGPGQGDIFDTLAACQKAGQMVTKCNAAHISFDRDPYVKYGGYTDHLPTLWPDLPKGWTLEPDADVCATAGEWYNYCKANVK